MKLHRLKLHTPLKLLLYCLAWSHRNYFDNTVVKYTKLVLKRNSTCKYRWVQILGTNQQKEWACKDSTPNIWTYFPEYLYCISAGISILRELRPPAIKKSICSFRSSPVFSSDFNWDRCSSIVAPISLSSGNLKERFGLIIET